MSLEQALNEATIAIKQLIVVLSTANEAGGALAASGEAATETTGKRGRKKAGDTTTATDTTTTGAASGPALNTTGTVLYFIIEKHNTAAAVSPGEVLPSIEGQRQVTQAEYEAYKAQIAAQFTAAQTQVQNVAVAQPVAAEELTMPKLTERLMAIHKLSGNDGVMKVLNHFKANSVPALASSPLPDVAAKIREVEVEVGIVKAAPAAGDSLFG